MRGLYVAILLGSLALSSCGAAEQSYSVEELAIQIAEARLATDAAFTAAAATSAGETQAAVPPTATTTFTPSPTQPPMPSNTPRPTFTPSRVPTLEVQVREQNAAGGGSAGNCHPSYPSVCLDPTVSDYDCAGGGGNGPEYVYETIVVLAPDPYELDRNGDGWGCEE